MMGVLSVGRDCVRDPLVPERRALLGNLRRGARQRPGAWRRADEDVWDERGQAVLKERWTEPGAPAGEGEGKV